MTEAMQTPADRQSELDSAINGFSRFIELCEGMYSLLNSVETAVAAESMWLAHAYWFRQFQRQLGAELRTTLQALTEWRTAGDGKKHIKQRLRELKVLIENLAVP